MRFVSHIVIAGVTLGVGIVPSEPANNPTIPISVSAGIDPDAARGRLVPLLITIGNQTEGDVGYSSYSLTPNDWNDETINLSLLDVYRDGIQRELALQRPAVAAPFEISGIRVRKIAPGSTLSVRTEATKWTIDGGWTPGRYEAKVRIERLIVDDGRFLVSVLSEPIHFEIPAPKGAPRAPLPVEGLEPVLPSLLESLRESLRSGTPSEKERALDLIRDLQAIRLVPEVIALIDDPTPLPRRGDTGWGFIGHQAASIMREVAIATDRAGMDKRENSSYSFHDDHYKGGEALKASGRLAEVQQNWKRWWELIRSAE